MGVLFIASWLKGNGVVVVDGSVEDSATAEISRSQVLPATWLLVGFPRCGSGSDTGQLWRREASLQQTSSARWWLTLWPSWERSKKWQYQLYHIICCDRSEKLDPCWWRWSLIATSLSSWQLCWAKTTSSEKGTTHRGSGMRSEYAKHDFLVFLLTLTIKSMEYNTYIKQCLCKILKLNWFICKITLSLSTFLHNL